MQSVLAAVDFLGSTKTVLEAAAAIARRRGASVSVIHVFEPSIFSCSSITSVNRAALAKEGAAAERLREIQEAFRVAGIAVHVRLLFGVPGPAILNASCVEKPSMIVLGAQRRSAFSRLFQDGTTAMVLKRADCPVLLVPPPTMAAADTFHSQTERNEIGVTGTYSEDQAVTRDSALRY
jgi:nucleotide-binding universal stress UspA family protein